MLSSLIAKEAIAMRPGLISGRYPERGDPEQGLIDRCYTRLQGTLARLTIDLQPGLRKVAANIGEQGNFLKGLSRAELENMLISLRGKFLSQGLSYSLCVQSFAIIREVSDRTMQLRHYDSQIMAAWVMLQGQLAEMETGEGKTLSATLAAATVAFAGIPVHVITVNEYLVERDAKIMEPLYKALGLTVGYVTQSMTLEQRRKSYTCDITYCTNNQVAFDYLRDRLLRGDNRSKLRLQIESVYAEKNRPDKFMLRGLCFAIVDEADSVLIDEARTPLILTRNVDSTEEHKAYLQALELARQLENGNDFFIDTALRRVQLSLAGQQKLEKSPVTSDGLFRGARLREELVCHALHALYLLKRDHDYLIEEDKVVMIDANTGRTMPDRSWERGLHQMVEAKEGCPLTAAREQLARLTYQRFFRRYIKLGGMSGTAREVSSELWSVYGLRVRRIPLHRPSKRLKMATQVYPSAKEKWAAVVKAVEEMQNTGRPVLIGSGSVADSEYLSRMLTLEGITLRILNARQNREESEIIAASGQKKHITIATNMAGRGTDIPLSDEVAELGGLHVLAACCNEAKRIDRQLSGRCARKGDPGSHQTILSMEDEQILENYHPLLVRFINSYTPKGGLIQRKLNLLIMRRAQMRIERRHREARRALIQHDKHTGRLLTFSGHME